MRPTSGHIPKVRTIGILHEYQTLTLYELYSHWARKCTTARSVFESAVQRSGLLTEDGGQTQLAGGAILLCVLGMSLSWASQFACSMAVCQRACSVVVFGDASRT